MSGSQPTPRLRPRSRLPRTLALAALVVAAACSDSGDPTAPEGGNTGGPTMPTAARIVVEPGTLLLTAEGATETLRATVYDAAGSEMEAEVSWESSAPSVLSVSADGTVTAGAEVGTATLTASVAGLSSTPTLGFGARAAEGVIAVPDSAILGDPEPLDPAAELAPGWRYRIGVRGVDVEAGQRVVGTGDRPLVGRVVEVADQGDGAQWTVEFIPLAELFDDLSVDLDVPLVEMEDGAAGAPAPSVPARGGAGGGLARAEGETSFDLGPFKCTASGSVPELDLPEPTLELEQELSLVFTYDNRLETYAVEGRIQADFDYRPVVKVAFEGKVGCEAVVTTVTVPLTGFLSWFVGIQVPLGVGMELSGKLDVAEVGFDVDASVEATARLGLICPASGGACTGLNDFDTRRDFDFEFISPDPDEQFKLTLGGLGYLSAKPSVGTRFSARTRWEFLKATAGLEQTVDLATAKAQAKDTAYASDFNLIGKVDVGPGKDLSSAMDKLGEWLGEDLVPDLTLVELRDTVARSPQGTFTITPAQVAPGDVSTLGDLATFRVELDPVTYLGLESVEEVEFLWRKPAAAGTDFTLESNRPACRRVAGGGGKRIFECQTDYLQEDVGEQTFHAFVHAKLFGVPIPVPLEVAADARASVEVGSQACIGPDWLMAGLTAQEDTTFNTNGGSYTTEIRSHEYGSLDASITATSGSDETEGATYSLDVRAGDFVCLQPEDPTLAQTDATLRFRVEGTVGTNPPDNVRGASSASATLVITDRNVFRESRWGWDAFSQAGEEREDFNEELEVTVPLGEWFRVSSDVALWASSNRGTNHTADAQIRYRFLGVEDASGTPLPLRATSSKSGTDYFAGPATAPVVAGRR